MSKTFEGYVKYADGSVICLQCYDGNHDECPDENDDAGVLDGYNCECG